MGVESEFGGQFVISHGHAPKRAGSRRLRLTRFSVDVFEPLPLVRVLDGHGRTVGCLLGTPIDVEHGRILTNIHILESDLGPGVDLDRYIEKEIYRLAGSFIFVLDTPDASRLYLDANGTKSVVYDSSVEIAAASSLLIFPATQDYFARLDRGLRTALRVDGEGWIPAGLTAHQGVQRLVCNHYLDLRNWVCVRHWPIQPIVRETDPGSSIAAIVDQTSRVIETLCRAAPTTLALTAGYDTRLLLACSRKVLGEIDFITVDVPGNALDIKTAQDLARRFGLRHSILGYMEANAEEMEAWQKKVSHCITGANLRMHPSMNPLQGRFFVGGVGGEVGRGFLWLNSEDDTRLDAAGILERLKLPVEPRVLRAVEAWLQPLRHLDSLLILDLAFMELRVSSWAFAQAYAPVHHVEINPLISRRTYQAMLALAPSVRRNNGMVVSAIKTVWPELLEIPVNRYGNWRDNFEKARAAAMDPKRAMRKLRQIASVKATHLFARWDKRPTS